MDKNLILFEGEMQLLAWSESHSKGATVTLQLADTEALEPFRDMTVRKGKVAGQRLAVVIVQINDDEQPVDQKQAKHPRGGPLAILSGQWCQEEGFQRWLKTTMPSDWDIASGRQAELNRRMPADHEIAAQVIRDVCGVASRADLDHDAMAGSVFHSHIRIPYAEHVKG